MAPARASRRARCLRIWPGGFAPVGRGIELQPVAGRGVLGNADIRHRSRQGSPAMKQTVRASQRLVAGTALAAAAILIPGAALAASAASASPAYRPSTATGTR